MEHMHAMLQEGRKTSIGWICAVAALPRPPDIGSEHAQKESLIEIEDEPGMKSKAKKRKTKEGTAESETKLRLEARPITGTDGYTRGVRSNEPSAFRARPRRDPGRCSQAGPG